MCSGGYCHDNRESIKKCFFENNGHTTFVLYTVDMYNKTKTVFWVVLKNDFDNFDDFLQVK